METIPEAYRELRDRPIVVSLATLVPDLDGLRRREPTTDVPGRARVALLRLQQRFAPGRGTRLLVVARREGDAGPPVPFTLPPVNGR